MKIKSTRVAIFVLPVVVWLTSAWTGESIAGDHYRIGTINKSYHYRDNEDFNDTHDGLYMVHNRNVFGTYHNSEYEQSFFYARNSPITDTFSFTYGVTFGYNVGMLPIVGVSAQVGFLKLTLTHEAAVVGLEFSVI
jgi:uncharacterized membrane protein YqaE (UPF0057 family)